MIFVTGPRFSGKRTYLQKTLGLSDEAFAEKASCEVQELLRKKEGQEDSVRRVAELADELCRREIVTASETGSGVIPVDADERAFREAAGRLSCLLAERADVVIRMCCGLPEILKGEEIFTTCAKRPDRITGEKQ